MTRINLVTPAYLTDKHLLAEYRELPRIFTAVRKLMNQGKTPYDVDIPAQYVLGNGHCKFFYNKIQWLYDRFCLLKKELDVRNFNIDENMYSSIIKDVDDISLSWKGRFKPSPEEIYLNMARLAKRGNIEKVNEELASDK